MTTLIEQTVFFDAPPLRVYEALMDSDSHAAFTSSQAEISREIGGAFMAYAGYITGTQLELIPGEKIVQRWRAMDWLDEQYSVVTFLFTAENGGTRLNFTQVDVPEGTEEEFRQGWMDNYWEPMKAFLKG